MPLPSSSDLDSTSHYRYTDFCSHMLVDDPLSTTLDRCLGHDIQQQHHQHSKTKKTFPTNPVIGAPQGRWVVEIPLLELANRVFLPICCAVSPIYQLMYKPHRQELQGSFPWKATAEHGVLIEDTFSWHALRTPALYIVQSRKYHERLCTSGGRLRMKIELIWNILSLSCLQNRGLRLAGSVVGRPGDEAGGKFDAPDLYLERMTSLKLKGLTHEISSA